MQIENSDGEMMVDVDLSHSFYFYNTIFNKWMFYKQFIKSEKNSDMYFKYEKIVVDLKGVIPKTMIYVYRKDSTKSDKDYVLINGDEE